MNQEKNPKIIKFEDVKKRIMDELNDRWELLDLKEQVTLVEGFLNEPFSKELSSSFVLGGPSVPMVILVGNRSGRIYFFALKALLGEL